MASGQFVKGDPRAGRPKGTPNKTTRAVREFLAALCDDPKVQASVRRKVLKGETMGFFKAVDKIVPDPPREVKFQGEFRMIDWPDSEDVADEG